MAEIAAAAMGEARAKVPVLGRLEDRRRARRLRFVRILFAVGLLAWTSLAVWWATYFYLSVNEVRDATLRAYAAEVRLFGVILGAPGGDPAILDGTVFTLAAVPLDAETSEFPHVHLEAPFEDRAIVVRPEERARIRHNTRNKYVMLAGEGTLLIGLLFACLVALYRMLVVEWALNRRRDSFVHAVTHELKSPLAGLRALLESLRTIDVPFAERRQYLELGLGEVQRLDGLVANILLTSRLESREWRPNFVETDLAALVRRVAERKRLRLAERGGELTVETEPLPPVRVDPEAVETILENLLENAIKYGAEVPHVRVSVRREGSLVQVAVADDGRGFPPVDAERLFEKFYRCEDSDRRAVKGTGLGLYLARSLARACDGELTAHSEGSGKGARFTLTIAS